MAEINIALGIIFFTLCVCTLLLAYFLGRLSAHIEQLEELYRHNGGRKRE